MKPRSLRKPADLAEAQLIAPARIAEIELVSRRFELAVTPAMAAIIEEAGDPIGRQFIPSAAELETAPEERADPIGDQKFSPVKGIVHRYPDRVLLKPSHLCPVYCRFCFRREQVGRDGERLSPRELEVALDYIRARPQIWEVIVTGGDPFLLSPRRIRALMGALGAIPHLGVIRFHSRMPIVSPLSITPALVKALAAKKAVYVVVHVNHPKELTRDARASCARLVKAGIPLLSQSVLLKGVNDDEATLEKLFRDLVALRIKPYYLHHADLARGTAHFRTSLEAGRALMKHLRGRVSGLCHPAYVLDLPGGFGKVPVGPCYARPGDRPHEWLIEDGEGRRHCYPPGTGAKD
jgi:lysine 2,3-aminomutase